MATYSYEAVIVTVEGGVSPGFLAGGPDGAGVGDVVNARAEEGWELTAATFIPPMQAQRPAAPQLNDKGVLTLPIQRQPQIVIIPPQWVLFFRREEQREG